ncbi:MAG TPA: (deoxy)nucleoside triphosphate pyrophosphohydrolase [Thermoflexia bacterium]|nr:(deoxy)nucleoside triphosphate pyrophosphohydrolase [Thermoflexia bacterium]
MQSPRDPPHYDVAAAVIIRSDGRVLVAQRLPGDTHGGLWEFPGGTREAGETLPVALRRELQEELEMKIAVGERLISLTHQLPEAALTLTAFRCQHLAGNPRCLECAAFRWVWPAELAALPMAVLDRQIARLVKTELAAR